MCIFFYKAQITYIYFKMINTFIYLILVQNIVFVNKILWTCTFATNHNDTEIPDDCFNLEIFINESKSCNHKITTHVFVTPQVRNGKRLEKIRTTQHIETNATGRIIVFIQKVKLRIRIQFAKFI